MSDKKTALEKINQALKTLHQGNSIKNNNQAMKKLFSAQRNYDGFNGMDMENVFDTNHIYPADTAITLLKAGANGEAFKPTKEKIQLAKKNLQALEKNHVQGVHLADPFKPTYSVKSIKHSELESLAQNMKQTVHFPPHAYKMMAQGKDINKHLKGENVNYALRSIVNYCIKHNQQGALKKNHLAEASSVYDSLHLFNKDAQARIKKQLKNMHSIGAFPKIVDVVKVHHQTTDQINVTRPTVKDVSNVVQTIHDNMQLQHKLLHKNAFSYNIKNRHYTRKHLYQRAQNSPKKQYQRMVKMRSQQSMQR